MALIQFHVYSVIFYRKCPEDPAAEHGASSENMVGLFPEVQRCRESYSEILCYLYFWEGFFVEDVCVSGVILSEVEDPALLNGEYESHVFRPCVEIDQGLLEGVAAVVRSEWYREFCVVRID